MIMTEQWAKYLNESGITFIDQEDRILFYDPEEKQGVVVVRQHIKSWSGPYRSKRISELTYAEYATMRS
jgi:hypothetical protein